MPLSNAQIRHLRRLGHCLKPIIIIGNAGLSEGVIQEFDLSLEHHELMKVKINAADRESRQEMTLKLVELGRCELVQQIGHIALFYRPSLEPKLKLPA